MLRQHLARLPARTLALDPDARSIGSIIVNVLPGYLIEEDAEVLRDVTLRIPTVRVPAAGNRGSCRATTTSILAEWPTRRCAPTQSSRKETSDRDSPQGTVQPTQSPQIFCAKGSRNKREQGERHNSPKPCQPWRRPHAPCDKLNGTMRSQRGAGD